MFKWLHEKAIKCKKVVSNLYIKRTDYTNNNVTHKIVN